MKATHGTYFPDLTTCLSGDVLLLSWDDVLQAILAHDSRPPFSCSSFLADDHVQRLLSKPVPAFPPPSPQSRSSFDSRTAAINITPSSSHQYDIHKIKEDALWLSTEANIDETEALRITLLEWQYRPEACLRAGFSDAELASLRGALGPEDCESLGLVPRSPLNRSESAFDSVDGTRSRLLQVYLNEKVRLLAVYNELLQRDALADSGPDSTVTDNSVSSPPFHPPQHTLDDVLSETCKAIRQWIDTLQTGQSWSLPEQYHADLTESNATSNLQSIALVLDLLLLASTRSDKLIPAEGLLQWLNIVRHVDHFANFYSEVPVQQTAITHIRNISACVSGSLLQPTTVLLRLSENPETRQDGYLYDYESLGAIHDAFVSFAAACSLPASIGVLTWALLLHEVRSLASYAKETSENRAMQKAVTTSPQDTRRWSISSAGSSHQSVFDEILREIPPGPAGEDSIDSLISYSLSGMKALDFASSISAWASQTRVGVFSITWPVLQDLVKQAMPLLGYSPDLLSTQNTLLECQLPAIDPAGSFIRDRLLMESFFDTATARFPYESLPLLQLCKSLARANVFDDEGTQYVTFRLRQLDFFTQVATDGFAAYHTIREDENANLVTLGQSVGIFDLQQHNLLTSTEVDESGLIVIPAKSIGEVISESIPPTIKWQYTYPGFALLGKWIEMHREGVLRGIVSDFEDPDSIIAVVISLLVALLQNTYSHVKATKSREAAQNACDKLLEDCSEWLHADVDLVNCIFELSEHQLQAARGQVSSIASRDLLAACVDFFTFYAKIYPSRAWPQITRSSLFSVSGAKKNVLSFSGAIEVPTQDFRLLEASSQLFGTMLDVALVLSPRDENAIPSAGRLSAGQRLARTTLSNCVEVMLLALEALNSWSFQNFKQKQIIFASVTASFYNTINYAFGSGEKADAVTPSKAIFMPAATALVQALQNPGLQSPGSGPLLQQLVSAVVDPKDVDILGNALAPTENTIQLLNLLLRCACRNDDSGNDFHSRLRDSLPLLVRLPLSQFSRAEKTCMLLSTVLTSIHPGATSILGHLGAASSVAWLDTLRHLSEKPQQPIKPTVPWGIYSSLVTQEQQWIAIALITGAPPGPHSKEQTPPKLQTQGKTYLQRAINTLSKPSAVDPQELASLLDFLLEAQRNWPSVSDSIAAESALIPALIEWICRRDVSRKQEIDQAFHNRVAALVTELAVLHFHRSITLRNEQAFTAFIPLLNWLAENGVAVAAYNISLHANLKKNFSMKYPNLEADYFRSSGLVPHPYGDDYFYDLELADKLIGDNPFWKSQGSGAQSFRAEFERANINLSIVDSELLLLRSIQYLSAEHASFFARNTNVARILSTMVSNCLVSNSRPMPAEKLFDTVFQIRADIAMTLLRALVSAQAKGSHCLSLLQDAWNALRFRNGSYEKAILNGDLQYWRSCLNILLLCLHFHTEKKPKKPPPNAGLQGAALAVIDPSSTLFVEIARDIVGGSLPVVVTALQSRHQDRNRSQEDDADSTVGAKDVALLLTICQTILRIPTLSQFVVQLSEAYISTGAAQTCISLYSWSHLLLENDEPVFATLSVRFLASLSSLVLLAEDLAVEGIFTRLLNAKFTQRLQNIPNGIAHLDRRPHGSLLYSVWSQGILPICLSVLHHVGGGVADEVSNFLNQFPTQLNRATGSLSGTPSPTLVSGSLLTLPLVTEVSTLSLVSYVLSSFRDAGASAAVDPDSILPLEAFDQHKRALADDVRNVLQQNREDRVVRTVPTNEREAQWQKTGLVNGRTGKMDLKVGNVLDDKIVGQLRQAQICLGEGEEEKS
ncbi:hypothetical protein DV737_g4828, partial [Chaetothyriales sp. CBS 132003]